MDRKDYDIEMYKLISDKTKFVEVKGDLTKKREGQLQRNLLKLKKAGHFDKIIYDKIYPVGLHPSRLYGTPKVHKLSPENPKAKPPFRPIVSSNHSKYILMVYLRHTFR